MPTEAKRGFQSDLLEPELTSSSESLRVGPLWEQHMPLSTELSASPLEARKRTVLAVEESLRGEEDRSGLSRKEM